VKAEHVFYDDIDGLPIALSPGTPFTVLETVGSIGEIVVKCSDQHPGFDIYHPDGHREPVIWFKHLVSVG
jgi:hypothetical protein